MSEVETEAGKWLLAEYARTPGDPKWYPGLGLDSTIVAIEGQAAEAALAAHNCEENEPSYAEAAVLAVSTSMANFYKDLVNQGVPTEAATAIAIAFMTNATKGK